MKTREQIRFETDLTLDLLGAIEEFLYERLERIRSECQHPVTGPVEWYDGEPVELCEDCQKQIK